MTPWIALERLCAACKCSVTLEINPHRDAHLDVEEWLENSRHDPDPEVRARMIEMDRVVHVQFYPDTPIGFHDAVHFDIQAAVDEALRILEAYRGQP